MSGVHGLPEPGWFTSTTYKKWGKRIALIGALLVGTAAVGGYANIPYCSLSMHDVHWIGATGLGVFVIGAIMAVKAYRERSAKREAWLTLMQDRAGAALDYSRTLLRPDTEDFLDARDALGRSALICALEMKNETAVKELVKSGKIDVNEVSPSGESAALLAVKTKNLSVIRAFQRSNRLNAYSQITLCEEMSKNRVLKSSHNWLNAYHHIRKKPFDAEAGKKQLLQHAHKIQRQSDLQRCNALAAAHDRFDALQGQGYVTFLHAQGGSNAAITDLITQTEVSSASRAMHPALSRPHVRFRIEGQVRKFKNAQEVMQYQIDDFGGVWSRDLLSVDAYKHNQREGESAHYFFNAGGSVTGGGQLYAYIISSLVESTKFQELFLKALSQITSCSPGARMNVIAIPKAKVTDPAQRYVYRSRPYGVPSDGVFTAALAQHQAGMDTDTTLGYQYRILLGNLDADTDTLTFCFDNSTPAQSADYTASMRDLAMWVRAIRRLEALDDTSSAEQLSLALLRLPFFTRRNQTEVTLHSPNTLSLDPIIDALEELLLSKQSLLQKHRKAIAKAKARLPLAVRTLDVW